ncbi:single-stranded DNA-binding protein [Nocardioides mesophilus]|uniref:Single-stranded DNA-binding protein n=1 Tax=Nocardioides mesophilus TaxID=433659 RepID=A0A7G9RAI6_9ACTN|nr:single-stranded DNA-binding protein [Nocardioides mesophilus]QNN52611.1 single-stranded DNA-binding protein [Nocardioides mesophilus]
MAQVVDEAVDGAAAETESGDGPVNEVVLVGRLTVVPEERVLPSGDRIVGFRLSVPRRATPMGKGSRQTRDWVDCVTASARCRRSALRWSVGDEVQVRGVLRRRFVRGAGAAGTRLEVEVLQARRQGAAR